jgi:hypothetical protein
MGRGKMKCLLLIILVMATLAAKANSTLQCQWNPENAYQYVCNYAQEYDPGENSQNQNFNCTVLRNVSVQNSVIIDSDTDIIGSEGGIINTINVGALNTYYFTFSNFTSGTAMLRLFILYDSSEKKPTVPPVIGCVEGKSGKVAYETNNH